MKYVVDRSEDDIVVCQNLETKTIINISKDLFLEDIADGDIVKLEDNKYVKDVEEKKKRLKIIEEKLKKLKKIN